MGRPHPARATHRAGASEADDGFDPGRSHGGGPQVVRPDSCSFCTRSAFRDRSTSASTSSILTSAATLLMALDASGGRRRRKRDTNPDAIGMAIKRRLLEETVRDDPAPDAFEGWLLERCLSGEPASGPVRAMALEVLAEWRSAWRVPIEAVTVYVPGSSATNAPSGSSSAAPLPASSDQPAVTPGIERPAASFAIAVKRTTSPVRTDVAAGSRVTRVTVFATTCMARARVAGPAFAVTVTRPGAKARSTPSVETLATRGLLEVKVTGSWRTSSCAL